MRIYIAIFFLFISVCLKAQNDTINRLNKPNTISINFDQDFWVNKLGLDEDRNYTMGFAINYSNYDFGKLNFLFFPVKQLAKLQYNLLGSTRLDGQFDNELSRVIQYPSSIGLIGNAFTPDNLTVSEPIKGDRPYSSLLLISTQIRYLDTEDNFFHTIELNVGALGLNVSKAVQTEIHSWCSFKDSPKPMGWGTQISNGGELTALYSYKVENLLTPKNVELERENHCYFDMKHGIKTYVGYYTGLNYSLSARLGLLDARNWMYNLAPLSSSHKVGQKPTYYSKQKNYEIFFYGELSPNFIFYNALLMGQIKDTEYSLTYNEIRPLVMEWNYGLGFSFPKIGITGHLGIMGKSNELKTDFYSRKHHWGSLNVSYSF